MQVKMVVARISTKAHERLRWRATALGVTIQEVARQACEVYAETIPSVEGVGSPSTAATLVRINAEKLEKLDKRVGKDWQAVERGWVRDGSDFRKIWERLDKLERCNQQLDRRCRCGLPHVTYHWCSE